MPTINVLDAHTHLWSLAGSPRLGATARAIIEDPSSELILPAIALAEVCWVVERGRVSLSVAGILAALDADPSIEVVPLDRTIIERSNSLTTIREMHDRQSVATALVVAERGDPVQLLTRDADITASGLVTVVG